MLVYLKEFNNKKNKERRGRNNAKPYGFDGGDDYYDDQKITKEQGK